MHIVSITSSDAATPLSVLIGRTFFFLQKQTLFYMCMLGSKFNQVPIITILLLTIFY
jgi:hypothetical protein